MFPFPEHIPSAGITLGQFASAGAGKREQSQTASQGSAKVICASPFCVDPPKNGKTLLSCFFLPKASLEIQGPVLRDCLLFTLLVIAICD